MQAGRQNNTKQSTITTVGPFCPQISVSFVDRSDAIQ